MLPNSDALVALLPHGPEFRFVDAVDAFVPGVSITARYRVRGDEPFLVGHFPGNPVFPGVIQLEALAQAGAIAVLTDARYAGKLPLFGGVEKVRWRRMVKPGDELTLEMTIDRLSARGLDGLRRSSSGHIHIRRVRELVGEHGIDCKPVSLCWSVSRS